MSILTIFPVMISLIVGGLIGYAAFHFHYKSKKTIDQLEKDLREKEKELEEANQTIENTNNDLDVLREETKRLKEENKEYIEVIAHLSNYGEKLRKASEKAQEMAQILSGYDPDLPEKINNLLEENEKQANQENIEENAGKKIF